MRQLARLSSVVPHSTAFLPPAFIAMLPPMVEASCDVGSTANARPWRGEPDTAFGDDAGTGAHGRHHVDARQFDCSTSDSASELSVLITAQCASSGTAEPV